ncbi:MAG: DUF3367 domain-containing protein [Deltaproteobacteria bacterium]|nr:DUF3367 domain-containing protein [Deltaproteobacteria bacterium]
MKKINSNTYLDIALIFVIGLVPLLWFKDGYNAIAGFDFAVYLNPVDTLKKSFYLWSDKMAGGYDISHEISSMPYYLLFSLPVIIGLDYYTAEKIVFVSIFSLQGFSMYFMLKSIFSEKPNCRAIALIGVVLYTFSYPVMAHFGRGNMMALLTYGLLPILIGLLYRAFTRPEQQWRYTMLIALLSFPIAATKGHPADFVALLMVTAGFILFHAAVSARERLFHILSFSFKTAVVCAFVNLWWIVPNLIYLTDFGLTSKDLVQEGFYNLDILSYYSRGTSILNVFRNERLDLWFDMPSDELFNPSIYQSPLLILIGILLPMLAFISVCRARNDRNIFFFSGLSIFAIFMAKGNHEPLGKLFEWLYFNIPGFFLFRAPYRVFSSLLLFAIVPLLAYSIGMLASKADESKKSPDAWILRPRVVLKILAGFFIFSLLFTTSLYAWPVFTGSHLREKGSAREPGVYQKIPPYYTEAEEWLRSEQDYSKIYFPYEVYDANTKWGYNGPDPTFELLTAPKVVSRPGGTVYIRYQRPVEALNKVFWNWKYGDVGKVLGLYNVRYVLLHDDFNRWVMPEYNFNEYAGSLLDKNGFSLKKKIGPLMLYENHQYEQRLTGASKAYLLNGDENAFPALSLTGHLDTPFLLMAKDAQNPEMANKFLNNAEGVIFFNSNHIDTVCELLANSYGYTYQDKGSLSLNASGEYIVFAKNSKGNIFLDSIEIIGKETEDGLNWANKGIIFLEKGRHTVALRNSTLASTGDLLIVPASEYKNLKAALLDKMSSADFEVIYIFDNFKDRSGSLSLKGSVDYEASSLTPVQYKREEADSFAGSKWKFEKPGQVAARASIELPSVDIGQYSEFAFPDFAKASEVILKIGLDGTKEESLKIEKNYLKEVKGSFNLNELVKRKFASSATHKLKRVEIIFEKSAVYNHLQIPTLKGNFGLVEKKCIGNKGDLAVGGIYLPTSKECNKWSGAKLMKRGDHVFRFAKGIENESLVLVRKKGVFSNAAKPDVWFQKLNPAKYQVRAIAQKDSKMVFNDSFDRDWAFYINGKKYEPLRVNGFANGFVFNDKGKAQFNLEYAPQKAYDFAKMASLFSATGIIYFGVRNPRKKKIGENERS